MNLWVKRTGQFFIAALFLMSCEDDSFLLGFKNPNKKFGVHYQEFTFSGNQTSVMLIDSISTDHYNLTEGNTFRFLVGQYNDPTFGTVRSIPFTQFQPNFYSQINKTGATYDSTTLELSLDLYTYGYAADSEEKFTIHEIMEDTLSYFERYYYNSYFGYNSVPIGEASIFVDYSNVQRNLSLDPAARDTFLIKATLDYEWGGRLFLYAASYDSALIDNVQYREMFKGLAIVPAQNNYILGVDPRTSLSKMTLHYHTATDTLERSFFFSPYPPVAAGSFNNIETTRIGDLASIGQKYEPVAPASGLNYLQNGSPVITKLDLDQYYNFIRGEGAVDSLPNVVINTAELTIGIETPPTGMTPPSTLVLRILKKVSDTNYQFMNGILNEDSVMMRGFYAFQDGRYYLAGSDLLTNPITYATLTYNKDKQQYKGYISLLLQNLFDRKKDEEELLYLGIFPVFPTIGKSVDRVVFKQENIKLGIYYTKPNLPNLD